MNNNINAYWTTEEICAWTKEGLIPKPLLAPEKHRELEQYVLRNKEMLYQCYQTNRGNIKCNVAKLITSNLPDSYELQVIDKKTGKIVKVLEQIKTIELCDGLSIQINTQELDLWEKEAAKTKGLTKEEVVLFQQTVLKLQENNLQLSRETIATTIEQIKKGSKKIGKFRQSGHLIDSKLKTNNDLFDLLAPMTIEKIEKHSVNIKTFGIRLTPSEEKIVTALYKILHEKSENKDINSEHFLAGNEKAITVSYGINTDAQAAVIRMKPSELYREYHGSSDYTGKDIINIRSILIGLSEKKFIIHYNRQRIVVKGKAEEVLTDRIEDVQSLIKIMSYIEGMTKKEVGILDSGDAEFREQREELVIALNPLLTDQIASKYIEYPVDIINRTMIASGGRRSVTESIVNLRDYMMREISVGRAHCELNEETLINQLRLKNYTQRRHKEKSIQKIFIAINVCKELGLILNSQTEIGSQGQTKYRFQLNPEFS